MPDYSWIPFFEELANKILEFKNNRAQLISQIMQTYDGIEDLQSPVLQKDVDPFTLFSFFNYSDRGNFSKKHQLFARLKEVFKLDSNVPTGESGIPQMDNRNRYFYGDNVRTEQFDKLWNAYSAAIKYSENNNTENRKVFIEAYDNAVNVSKVGMRLVQGFYWIRPNFYISLDGKNVDYIANQESLENIRNLKNERISGEQYLEVLEAVKNSIANKKIDGIRNIPELSLEAYKIDIDYKKILEYIDYISQYWDEKYAVKDVPQEILERNELIKSKAKDVKDVMTAIHKLLSDKYGFTEKEIHQWQNSGNLIHYVWMETMKNEYKDKPVSISFFADRSSIDNTTRFGVSFEINEKYASKHSESWDLYYKYLDYPLGENSSLHYYQDSHSNNQSGLVSLTAEEIKSNIDAFKNSNDKIKLCCFINKKDEYENSDYEKLILQAYEQVIPFYDYVVGDANIIKQSGGEEVKIMNEIREFQKNMILYGPPGTSKTYSSSVFAVGICEGKTPKDIIDEASTDGGYKEVMKRYEDLKNKGRIKFTTFHQSYGYEEFIEGIRPTTEDNQVKYSIEDGIFKKFCMNATLGDEFDDLFNNLINMVNSADDHRLVIDTESGSLIGLTVNSNGNLNLHIKNKTESDGAITKDALKDYYFDTENKKKYWSGYYRCIINYIKKKIGEANKKPYVFVIDEINRGNISKIFGELITLIEPSKRTGKNDCVPATLPYSGDEFSVPDNVYIIGTMNTADRSISLIDTALRRRFKFVEMMPDTDLFNNIVVDGVNIKTLIETINNRIIALYDREHTLGHAYFIDLRQDENKNIKTLGSIFKNQIIPLLQEYFYDDYNKIRLILGDNAKPEDEQFIKVEKVDSKLFKNGGEIPDFAHERFVVNNAACYNINSYRGII